MPYKSTQVPEWKQAHFRTMRRQAVEGYSQWVQQLTAGQEALFVTITHEKKSYHPEQSARIRRHWLNILNKRFYGSNYDRNGLGLVSVFAFERQERGTIHQHGIIAGAPLKGVHRVSMAIELEALAHGGCRVELPHSKERSIKYCMKYVAKEGDVEFWLPRAMRITL